MNTDLRLREDELVLQGETYLGRRTMEPYSGPIVKYYSAGGRKVYHSFTLRNGKIDGLYERYFMLGELSRKENYTDGRLDGPFETHYSSGQLQERGTHTDGERCSEWIMDVDGKTRPYPPCPPGN
jgi:antitoxin component YwqK of YwqJK toxin-antitoxin module